MSKKWILGISLVVLAGVVAGWWMFRTTRFKAANSLNEQYDIITPELRDLSEKVDATGTVTLNRNGDIYPAYTACVLQVNCQPGQRVKKGEILMVLESTALKTEWVTAENSVRKAEVNLVKAQKDLERVKLLYEAQGATIDDVETAKQQVDLYREDLKLAQFSLEQLRKEPDGANFLAADHQKLWIKAPFDGVISKVDAKPGAKVDTDTLLLNIVADDAVEIVADVDESQINQIKVGQTASVILNDNDETEISGTVTAIGKTGSEDSGVIVFPVTIQLSRTDKINSGMSADITIYITSRQDVLSIPVNAVVKKRGRNLVNVLRGKTVERVEVELGIVHEGYVEVLGGVRPNDRILVAKTQVKESKNADSQRTNQNPLMGAGPMGGPPPGGR